MPISEDQLPCPDARRARYRRTHAHGCGVGVYDESQVRVVLARSSTPLADLFNVIRSVMDVVVHEPDDD